LHSPDAIQLKARIEPEQKAAIDQGAQALGLTKQALIEEGLPTHIKLLQAIRAGYDWAIQAGLALGLVIATQAPAAAIAYAEADRAAPAVVEPEPPQEALDEPAPQLLTPEDPKEAPMFYEAEPEIPWYVDPLEVQPTPAPAPIPMPRPLPAFEEEVPLVPVPKRSPPVQLPPRRAPVPVAAPEPAPEGEDPFFAEMRRRHEQREQERLAQAHPSGSYGEAEAKVLAELTARGISTQLPGVLPKGETPLSCLQKRLKQATEGQPLEQLREEARRLGLSPEPEGIGWSSAEKVTYEEALKSAIARARAMAPKRNDHPWGRKVWPRGGQ
jgi:hypothetical protein